MTYEIDMMLMNKDDNDKNKKIDDPNSETSPCQEHGASSTLGPAKID